jgi:hypothetical protein
MCQTPPDGPATPASEASASTPKELTPTDKFKKTRVRDMKIGSVVCAVSPFQMTHARRMMLNGYSARTV